MESSGLRAPGFGGRVAVVTGGGRGIGRAIADALFEQGASVAVFDLSDPGDLPAGDGSGPECRFVACDVSDEASVDQAFSTVESEMGPASILVNNAGILRALTIEETALDDWNAILSVNLTGAFLCARRALPAMAEAGYGRVVTIGSSAGKTGGYSKLAAYAASKAGVHALAKSIAQEYARAGITSNAIAPAAIATDMITGLSGFEENIPVGRLGTPQDVAAAVVFLASETAGYVTAEVMDVNGGYLID
jgi:3-oxoacyl-[acyl-carrier protein] reductase